MQLERLARRDFVLLESSWPAEDGRELLDVLDASHVIVHRDEPQDAYNLFARDDVLSRLARGGTVRQALDLHETDATPLLDAHTSAEDAPDRCIVREEGRVVGFFDATVIPAERATRSGQRRGAEAAPVPAAAEQVKRSLVGELPASVPLDQPVSLVVYITATPPTAPGSLPFTLRTGSTVDIVVQARSGFVVEGSGEASLTVTSDDETMPIQFKVRGVELGAGQLRILAFVEGHCLGMLTLGSTVSEATEAVSAQWRSESKPLASVTVTQPDLSLLILEGRDEDGTTLTMRLTAADPAENLNLKLFGPVRLRTDPASYFSELFTDIENMALDTVEERRTAEAMLAARGASLFANVFPAELQRELWRLRDRITSVQVLSEEPWIPWEICQLVGEEDGRVQDGPFLCEAFAITRWLPGISRRPQLTLNNLAVVVPDDSELPFAGPERDYLLSLADGDRFVRQVPATFLDVRRELASGTYDGWHFSGHGAARSPNPDRAEIFLEKQQRFTPEELSGAVGNLGRARPLVFLNACQVGRTGMSLTDIGGWGRQFLHCGAAAFIGTYWSVYDEPAFAFTRALYPRLLAGEPIGKAAQEARSHIKSLGDPTWLAYTVFADPLAALQ